MAHPKPLAVIGQNTQGGPGLVAENKKGAAKRLCVVTHNRFYVANYDMLHNEIMPLELRIGELFADT